MNQESGITPRLCSGQANHCIRRSATKHWRTPAIHQNIVAGGFTLIELMLVVIIIGILASMVMPRLVGKSEQARKAAAQADIESNIATALDMYEVDNGSFPEEIKHLREKPAGAKNWNGPYLKKDPKDPWRNEYVYQKDGDNYKLSSKGKDGTDGTEDDIKSW